MKPITKNKLQIILIILGVTAGVCLIIKYMLPLVTPFIIALIISVIIDKPVGFLSVKLHIKRTIGAVLLVLVVMGVIIIAVFFLGKALVEQIRNLAANYEGYMKAVNEVFEKYCVKIDEILGLNSGCSMNYMSDQMEKLSGQMSDSIIPTIMNSSINVIAAITIVFTTIAFTIMAAVFISRDMEKIRMYERKTIFRDEIAFIKDRIKNILGVYIRTQFIIMSLTCGICTVGLYFTGNPYALLLGVLIGIIDAFPILGTGTVFIPWIIVLVISGKYKLSVCIFVIYIICYYTRQFLEPRLMGDSLGMSPIVMLISLYTGLVLFGISGVITGPIAAILIKEIAGGLIDKIKNL